MRAGSCTRLSRASEDDAKQSSIPGRARTTQPNMAQDDALSPARSRQRPTNQSGRISGRTTPWLRTKRSLRDRPRLLIGARRWHLAGDPIPSSPSPPRALWMEHDASRLHPVCIAAGASRHMPAARRGRWMGWELGSIVSSAAGNELGSARCSLSQDLARRRRPSVVGVVVGWASPPRSARWANAGHGVRQSADHMCPDRVESRGHLVY